MPKSAVARRKPEKHEDNAKVAKIVKLLPQRNQTLEQRGRPKKLVKFATENGYFNALVDEHFDELFRALLDSARGHLVQGEVLGRKVIYSKSPSVQALEYMFNRRLGKPIERVATPDGKRKVLVIDMESADDDEEFEPDVDSDPNQ